MAMAVASASPAEAGEKVSVKSLGEAESRVRAEVQTGTLLVTEGDCLAIRIYTQSPYTHVAVVVVRNGKPFVYDSANGAGVRCSTLKNYLSSQSPSEIHVFHPKREFSKTKNEKLEEWLDSQLGRPYAISHHLSGERAAGLHCSEYVMDAMQHCGVLKAKRPSRVSPASLVTGITKHGIYTRSMVLQVEPVKHAPQPASDSWCGSLWEDTKTCTSDCYRKTKGWIFCR